jgi:hypothetical protein
VVSGDSIGRATLIYLPKGACQIECFVEKCPFSRAVTRRNLSETKPVERKIEMLKQNLTKVIAVATIAAAGVFVSGCAEEAVEDDGTPAVSEDGAENENDPHDDPDAGGEEGK